MAFILFDIEVFKYNFLCGFKNYETGERIRIWDDYDAVIDFVKEKSKTHMFVGYNNNHYDDHIINAIFKRVPLYPISKAIVTNTHSAKWARVPYASIDIAALLPPGNSLSLLESNLGISIEESNVDFEIDRPLTFEEKLETEKYNDHDIDALELIFKILGTTTIKTKFDMINYFGLDLFKNIGKPLPTIMALGLKAERGYHDPQPWRTYEQLRVDKETQTFLEKELYLHQSRDFLLAGVPHRMGLGGLHGALANHREPWGYLLDAKGYYTLLQLNYRLLSRSLGEEGYIKVNELYRERLRRAERGDETAQSLKEGVLSIWGAVRNEYHLLYDPSYAVLITLTGQAFLIDLVQVIEPYVDLIQSNTDGIFVVPKDRIKGGELDLQMREAIKGWVERTGFELSIDTFSNLWQKDVNNYACIINDKKVKAKGGYINAWDADKESFLYSIGRRHKQGAVVDKALINYFLYGKALEDTINEETDLSMFQYTARKVGANFTNVLLKLTDKETGEVNYKRVFQKTNRVFAVKPEYKTQRWEFVKIKPKPAVDFINMGIKDEKGIIYHDEETGEVLLNTAIQQVALIPSMPDDVFVYNSDMHTEEAREYILKRLDREHYIKDALKKLNDYLGIKPIKAKRITDKKITLRVYNERERSDMEALLASDSQWAREQGMIGEVRYAREKDVLTLVAKEEEYKIALENNITTLPIVDINTGRPLIITIQVFKRKRPHEEIILNDAYTFAISNLGDYGFELKLLKGKTKKIVDTVTVENYDQLMDIINEWSLEVL